MSVDLEAMSNDLVGKAFQDGARGPEAFDCWGLVLHLFATRGVVLEDYAIGAFDTLAIHEKIRHQKPKWLAVQEPQAWDVCLFSLDTKASQFINHIGLHLSASRFIHAIEQHGVHQSKIDRLPWKARYQGSFRWQG